MYPEVYLKKGWTGPESQAKFSPENQDKMAMVYLEEDGYSKFKAGKISAQPVRQQCCLVPGLLPPHVGWSFSTRGVGSNKSLVSRQKYMKAIEASKYQKGGIVNVKGSSQLLVE